jgi:hypothetical protein
MAGSLDGGHLSFGLTAIAAQKHGGDTLRELWIHHQCIADAVECLHHLRRGDPGLNPLAKRLVRSGGVFQYSIDRRRVGQWIGRVDDCLAIEIRGPANSMMFSMMFSTARRSFRHSTLFH